MTSGRFVKGQIFLARFDNAVPLEGIRRFQVAQGIKIAKGRGGRWTREKRAARVGEFESGMVPRQDMHNHDKLQKPEFCPLLGTCVPDWCSFYHERNHVRGVCDRPTGSLDDMVCTGRMSHGLIVALKYARFVFFCCCRIEFFITSLIIFVFFLVGTTSLPAKLGVVRYTPGTNLSYF